VRIWKEPIVSQSYTFIDAAGNQAQYTIHEKDYRDEFYWSTDHGDHGTASSLREAQDRARAVLKTSMAARRRPDQWHR
jgi:hypothetical protein